MQAATIKKIFQRFAKQNPEPKTELIYNTPFELLIAVVLSAQETDISVYIATKKLFAVANTPKAIYQLGVDGLIPYIKTIGLFNSKAKHVIETCHILLTQHQGQVPEQRKDLEALPGVGRKTANVILNTAFGHPTMAVDTHIFRLANRIGIAPGKTPLAVEKKLVEVIPDEFLRHAHHWLILHGRYVCTARQPQCSRCIIADLCPYPDKTE